MIFEYCVPEKKIIENIHIIFQTFYSYKDFFFFTNNYYLNVKNIIFKKKKLNSKSNCANTTKLLSSLNHSNCYDYERNV